MSSDEPKQVVPPSILGDAPFEAASSVLEPRFGGGEPFTLGVEEEYMLLDGTTLDLVQHIEAVLAAVSANHFEGQISGELMQSVLEIATPICSGPAEIERQLRRLRAYVSEVAAADGLRIGSAGTHPFSLFERQQITAKDRYRTLVDQLQYVARRELIFGLHIHVAVDDADMAVHVVNGLLQHLGEFVALSASSPFWRAQPTGLRSVRQLISGAGPRSGPPPRFRDYADYAAVVGRLERTGCIADYTEIWWDVRVHPRLGTIEIRVCDATTRLEDSVSLSAYCQALVKHYCELYERRAPMAPVSRILTSENKWLAARYGLDAPLVDLWTESDVRVPARTLIERTLAQIAPHARELGADRELEGVRDILAHGNGADRQLQAFAVNGEIVDVAALIAEQTTAAASPTARDA
ncbi:MAG TPA: carboxylate-amine ligase [Gaiellaceae bacterium]|nr:carboxylate-amine ligase [Gaiellaceae bacterium]